MSYEYDPKYPDTTTTMNNEGNPGANDPYGYDEHDNDDPEPDDNNDTPSDDNSDGNDGNDDKN